MPDITIPDAAVEAAARAIAYADQSPYLNADQAEERVMRTLGGYRMLARKGLIAAAPHIAAQVALDIHGQFGVNVSDEISDWWDGYRQAQRDVLRKLREIEAYYRIEADHG